MHDKYKTKDIIVFRKPNGLYQRGKILTTNIDSILVEWDEKNEKQIQFVNKSLVAYHIPECETFMINITVLLLVIIIFSLLFLFSSYYCCYP